MVIKTAFEYFNQIAGKNVPKMRYDDNSDFFEWQEKARTQLEVLLGLNNIKRCNIEVDFEISEEKDTYIKQRFIVKTEENFCVPCCMLVPKEHNGRCPLMICLQGHTTGMHISYGEEKYDRDKTLLGENPQRAIAIEAVKRGYIAIAMEQRYMGELGHDEHGTPACVNGACRSTLLLGRTAVGERVWDVMRLIDAVEKYIPEVNCSDISCMGGSGGGTTTFYAACIDRRIKCALPTAAICTYKKSIIELYHCNCNYIPKIAEFFDMGDLGGLIAPRILVITNGIKDDIFPKDGAEETGAIIKSLYKKCGKEEMFRLCFGPNGHAAYTSLTFDTLKEIKQGG